MATENENGNQVTGLSEGNKEEGQNSNQNPENWEEQAKYFQGEKDKLYQENQKLQDYRKIGEFLESRPDITQVVTNMAGGNQGGQPQANQPITLDKDEFDPWEAYNKPSSKSYQYRMQEMSDVVQSAVSEQVQGVTAAQGMQNLKMELEKRGLDDSQINDFMQFASKNPAEYGIDGVLNMWQSVQGNDNVNNETEAGNQKTSPSPLDHIRNTQNNPAYGGLLGGETPKTTSDDDEVWNSIMNASGRHLKI
tara:strand:- start:608 stop:1357 length:750 start_codon:yes stop_codon:yes gene_type:complete